jgi:hypothetical protein
MLDDTDSRLLDASLTTFSPVSAIFSVSWSTAMLDGAHTSTCACASVTSAAATRSRSDACTHSPHGTR